MIDSFVGPVCRSRYGRTARNCALPVLHDGDHEDDRGSWHRKPPHRLGTPITSNEEPSDG
jgi:hypothetical protein